jgi:hypothetical protein
VSATDGHDRVGTENPEVRFEHADVEPAVVARFAVGLAVLTIATSAVAVWLLVFLRHREEAQDPSRPPLYFSTEHRQPDGVRLQTAPFTDLHVLREQERQILSSYGWVDQAAGVVHIPIDQAMSALVARQAGAAAAPGAVGEPGVPTDSAPVPSPMPSAGAAAAPRPEAHP